MISFLDQKLLLGVTATINANLLSSIGQVGKVFEKRLLFLLKVCLILVFL
jgi:hypothetical protein